MTLPSLRIPRFGWALAALLLAGAPALAQAPLPTPPPGQTLPAPPPAAPTTEPDKPSGDVSSVKPIDMAARATLGLSGKADWDDGYKTIMEAIGKLRAEAKRAGLTVTGHPLTVFRSTDDVGFRFDAMLLVNPPAADVQLGGDFKIMQTPSGRAVKFEHRSSYEEIESTYEAITAWLDEKGLDSRDLFIEEYLNDGKGSDDTDLQVDIYVFVK